MQGVFRNGNYYPEINKADLDQVYSLAKSKDSGVKENDVKNLKGLLAYVHAYGHYPKSRASVSKLYNVLLEQDKEGDDTKDKVRAFFKSLKDDFHGYIPNDDEDIPPLQDFADNFGDWHTQLITGVSNNNVSAGKAPLVKILEKHNLVTKRRDDKEKNVK